MQRSIELEGCFNFRDLGGYPTQDGRTVAWRRLYRSDGLHHLTQPDVAKLDELDLGHVVDLRSSQEVRTDGRGLLGASSQVRFHHLPLFDGQSRPADSDYDEAKATLADRYFYLTDFAREPLRDILHLVATSDRPLVYHCAAGKDRTGVVSAVVLGLLGVRDEVIIADYAASKENLDAIIDRLMATEGYQSMLEELPPDTMHAEPETMAAFLRLMRERFGSMSGFASAAGVADDVVEQLRARLLEPEAS